ncbi:hypothetical protein LXA43DRAFT_1103461 [Ganoderma leucocontextum]|nr:hypothetical protein LXA43DRAFT_1103461 [Ganoderma leucocontextum]
MAVSVNSPVTIFFFPEPWENCLFGPIDKVTILVDSGALTVPFVVPTGDFDPDNGKPDFFERWIQRIQGPTVSGTGITEEEREQLLHFALGYRAFYAGREDIPVSAYYEFVGLLVAETLALQQPEPAGHALEAAIEWIHGNLPADIFDEPDIHIPPITPHTHIDDPQVAEMLVNAPADFSPTGALIEMCAYLVPARTTYGERAPAASSPEGQTILRVPPSSVSTEREYMILPTKPQTDSGYSSDDSMPSLCYVTDSSDDDDEQYIVD